MTDLPDEIEKADIKKIPCPLMNRLAELGSEDAICHPQLKRKAVACVAKQLRDTDEIPDMGESMKEAWARIKGVCGETKTTS